MAGAHDYLGQILAGRFRIDGVLGSGGMGVVLRAFDLSSQRHVAVKLATTGQAPNQVARFLREGEVSASLDHPGIVRIYSSGAAGDRPYLVYELIEGARELDALFAERDLAGRVELVTQVAIALGYAHARGVIHRDVKPANVLVDREGRVRLADFGIARVEGAERLTATGALIGTPHYMSPECFRAKGATPASDVWSVGVLLYEALTGELPFPGQSLQELAPQIALARPAPPSQVAPNVPRRLQEICLRCLRAAPEERYSDGAALAEDLARAARGEDLSESPLRSSRFALGALGVFLILGLALAAAFSGGGPSSKPTPSPASTSPSESAAPEDSDPGARWVLGRGDRFVGRLVIRDTWTPTKDGAAPLKFLVELELEFQVRDLRGASATLDARVRHLVLSADSLRLDSRPDQPSVVEIQHVNGRVLTVFMRTDTGEIRRVHGMNALRDKILEMTPVPIRTLLTKLMIALSNDVVQRSLDQGFHQLSVETPTPPAWLLERQFRINADFAFGYQAKASLTDTGTRWSQESWRTVDVTAGDRLTDLEIRGESTFRGGRVVRARTDFTMRVCHQTIWEDLVYEVSYEELE